MVAGVVRHVQALTAGLLAAVTLGACADDLGSVAQQRGVGPPAIVRLSEQFAVAARGAGDGVEVVAFDSVDGDGWTAEIIASGGGGRMTVHLVTMGGATGQEWNSFLFGTAPQGSSRVVVDGFAATGGQVEDGTWVVAFRARDLSPRNVTWSVLDAIGAVIESGKGIKP